jgi:hypothetical protein
MREEKRFGMGPVPSLPKHYLNEKQVTGMGILRKFGWKLVCIRRPSIEDVHSIFINRREDALGVLGADGVLRIDRGIKIRKA